ncbi:hypothetical protein SESBI_01694 [Sesbania bispinosa]|nr:hypothetical protein SESBI_01694 [Sesbania bispinosa]
MTSPPCPSPPYEQSRRPLRVQPRREHQRRGIFCNVSSRGVPSVSFLRPPFSVSTNVSCAPSVST